MSPNFLPKLVILCFFLFILLDNIEGHEERNGFLNGTKTRSKPNLRNLLRKANVARRFTNLLKPKQGKGSYLPFGDTVDKKTSFMDEGFLVEERKLTQKL